MEINIVELIVQAGALGLTAMLLYGLWKYGGGFVGRLMDNLDAQARNIERSIEVQGQVAANLARLCEKLDGCEVEIKDQGSGTTQVLRDLADRIVANDSRAQKRYEQQMAHAEQRHAELIGILKGLNGKPKP
jgi:hypothetical protein